MAGNNHLLSHCVRELLDDFRQILSWRRNFVMDWHAYRTLEVASFQIPMSCHWHPSGSVKCEPLLGQILTLFQIYAAIIRSETLLCFAIHEIVVVRQRLGRDHHPLLYVLSQTEELPHFVALHRVVPPQTPPSRVHNQLAIRVVSEGLQLRVSALLNGCLCIQLLRIRSIGVQTHVFVNELARVQSESLFPHKEVLIGLRILTLLHFRFVHHTRVPVHTKTLIRPFVLYQSCCLNNATDIFKGYIFVKIPFLMFHLSSEIASVPIDPALSSEIGRETSIIIQASNSAIAAPHDLLLTRIRTIIRFDLIMF